MLAGRVHDEQNDGMRGRRQGQRNLKAPHAAATAYQTRAESLHRAMTAADQKQHRLGLMLVALAALCWSSAGFFTRLISTDLLTMLFWRGLFSGSAVFLVFFLIERGRARTAW
jgi:uncharacterized membrane protein YjjP (DUF1212 family)